MKINVIDKTAKNLNITVSESTSNIMTISITEKENKAFGFKTLDSATPGSIVTIGKRKYIVLDHATETTALLDTEKIDERAFDNENGNYEISNIRKYLNNKYYKKLCLAVGKDNIIKHKVNLEADDGTNKGTFCEDFVSLITTANYRRYREYIPITNYAWWTATRLTAVDEDYSRGVCCASSRGMLGWCGCAARLSVRPFIVLKSSVLVS